MESVQRQLILELLERLRRCARMEPPAGPVDGRGRMLKKKVPSLAEFSDPEHDRGWAFLKIVPKVVSIIDYTKGFGHTVLCPAHVF